MITFTRKTARGNEGNKISFTLEQYAGIDEEMCTDDTVWVSIRTAAAGRGFVETMGIMESRDEVERLVSEETQRPEAERSEELRPRPPRRLGQLLDETPQETARFRGWGIVDSGEINSNYVIQRDARE